MKVFLMVLTGLTLQLCSVHCQTLLQGRVTEVASGEPVLFGSIALYMDGVLVTGTDTDFDGNYRFSNIKAGMYSIEVKYIGMKTLKSENIEVRESQSTILNIELEDEDMGWCGGPHIPQLKVPLIDLANTTSGQIFRPNDGDDGKTYVLFKGKSYFKGKIFGYPSLNTLSKVKITLYRNGKLLKEITCNKQGKFFIWGLKRGKYEAIFECPGFFSTTESFRLKSGKDITLNIRMKEHDY